MNLRDPVHASALFLGTHDGVAQALGDDTGEGSSHAMGQPTRCLLHLGDRGAFLSLQESNDCFLRTTALALANAAALIDYRVNACLIELARIYEFAADGEGSGIGDTQGEGGAILCAAPDDCVISGVSLLKQPALEQAFGDVTDSTSLQLSGDGEDAPVFPREGRHEHGQLGVTERGHELVSSYLPADVPVYEDKPLVRGGRAGCCGEAHRNRAGTMLGVGARSTSIRSEQAGR
jgi:hypothetical protein